VKRQKGISSLAMVLMILMLGSLLLAGHNQQLNTLLFIVNAERHAIQQQAGAQSAMEWARTLGWQPVAAQQCQKHPSQTWWACLRPVGDDQRLLIAGSEGSTLWRLGSITSGEVEFSRHGWSDFCPIKETALCQAK